MTIYRTEKEARDAVVKCALKYIGVLEGTSQHKAIIDAYNKVSPLPRNYTVKYSDSWCATFITFIFDQMEMAGLIERECGCQEMINKCKKRNLITFKREQGQIVGNVVFYDWQGDGHSDHVGIIERVSSTQMVVIEGNHDDAVKERVINKNSKSLMCYLTPHYEVFVEKEKPKESMKYAYENLGWNKDSFGWWYAYGHNEGEYHKNNVVRIDKQLYMFDTDGYLCDGSNSEFTSKGAVKYIRGNKIL